ncbi:MAG: ATP-binding protein, partial [Verrucomicrobia bacterium]|nr:ATP-binding protein [Verrucomicrobiota bacterium]
MKTTEIFVSAPADVQEERAVVERVIRSVGAEFDYTVSASHSSRLRRLESEELNAASSARGPSQQGLPLRVCFWEHPDDAVDERLYQVPNPGQFDLVVCLLWSRLGPPLAPKFVVPDGSVPASSTEYEVAWALDQARITPGFPTLQVYRNRSVPDVPLEPREAREAAFRRWDAVQELFETWQRRAGDAFTDSCRDYRSLEEFEVLFRTRFRRFLAERANRETNRRASAANASVQPFRGLYPFDYRHATLFHGRTRATRELLEVLKKQVAAGHPFALVIGPAGAGKSSLVRAGVLPLLVRAGAGIPGWHGPWRRAFTRPGAVGRDANPLDGLVATLLEPVTAHGADGAASTGAKAPDSQESQGSEWRQNPGAIARRVLETLGNVTLDRLDRLLDQQERDFARAGRRESAELASQPRLAELGAKTRLVLVVDQFEELFTAGFPFEVQRRYIAALVALARTGQVFVVATLASDFYGVCQQFPELIEITAPSGRYHLQPPTAEEVGQMVRWRAEVYGWRFESHPRTDQPLDEFIVQAALTSPDELPQLEHLLTRLCARQTERGDGVFRWSDYAELGGFEGALAQHAESAFAALDPQEQAAADFVLQQLAAPEIGGGTGGAVWARTISARELVSGRAGGEARPAAAKTFIDTFLREGFLRTDKDPRGEMLVTVAHDVLLRKWPRTRALALSNRDAHLPAPPERADGHRRTAAPMPAEFPQKRETQGSKAGRSVVNARPKPVPTKRTPFAALFRKLKAPKTYRVREGSSIPTGFLMVLLPVGALVAALGFTAHLWLQKQAEEDAARKRADEALAAAFEPLRRQENAVPGGTAAGPTPAAVTPGPTAT